MKKVKNMQKLQPRHNSDQGDLISLKKYGQVTALLKFNLCKGRSLNQNMPNCSDTVPKDVKPVFEFYIINYSA